MEGAARAGCKGVLDVVVAPAPPPQPIPQKIRSRERAPAAAMFALRGNRSVLCLACRNAAKIAASRRMAIHGAVGNGGEVGMRENGAICETPKVLTETVNETGLPFETGRLPGTVHVDPKGAPEQLKERVPLKPAPGTA